MIDSNGVLWYHPVSSVAPVAQVDRASDFESAGRRFESCRAYQFISFRAASSTVEQLTLNQEVRGSRPWRPIRKIKGLERFCFNPFSFGKAAESILLFTFLRPTPQPLFQLISVLPPLAPVSCHPPRYLFVHARTAIKRHWMYVPSEAPKAQVPRLPESGTIQG